MILTLTIDNNSTNDFLRATALNTIFTVSSHWTKFHANTQQCMDFFYHMYHGFFIPEQVKRFLEVGLK